MRRPHLLRAQRKAARRNLAAASLAAAGLLATVAAPADAAATRTPPDDGMPRGGHHAHCRPAPVAQLDAAIRQTMRQAGIPGAIVGFWRPGECDYAKAFGVADVKTGAPMRADFNMRIGSETKTFVATALLELVDQHRVRLDDPISKYVAGVPDGQHITLRQLAGMRSGLFPYTADPGFIKDVETNPLRSFTPQQLLDIAFKHPNLFPPGTQYTYSNTNYILLGLVVEKVGHRPLAEFLKDCVTGPSDMERTIFPQGAYFPKPHPRGYTNQTLTGQIQDFTDLNSSWIWSAGAMISTLQDLRKWAPIVATGRLLSPRTQAERTDFLPTDIPGVTYGLGLADAYGWIGHDGEVPGFESLTLYLPEQHATLVILVNSDVPFANNPPSSLLGNTVTSIVTPDHVFKLT